EDLKDKNLILFNNYWQKMFGAKELFHPDSMIRDWYYLYKYSVEYNVGLSWSANENFWTYATNRLAISVKDGDLQVVSYNGALIDYQVNRIGNTFDIEILNVIDEFAYKNLHLGKVRNSGEDLILEVKEENAKFVEEKIKTDFVISLHNYNTTDNQEVFLGQFAIEEKNMFYNEGVYHLLIGSLNFPAKYKKSGQYLKVNLSVHRKYNNQTRVYGLKGKYKI
ncbi:MAG: hypothetical protein HON90_10920, partial [Halobacteriovoraceae bacterium]|nr:hypothetical protein [Halobacteriovoraceae bacterium]